MLNTITPDMPLATAKASTPSRNALRPRPRSRARPAMILTHVALLVSGIIWIYPFLWALGSSLKSNEDFFDGSLLPWPANPLWSNYIDAWQGADFSVYFLNTVVITVLSVVITLLSTAMAGYVLARTRFPGRGLLLGLIGATLFLPHGYTIIPIFDLIDSLGLLDSLWAIILVQSSSGLVFGTFMFMGYFQSIDPALEDAAKMDGAGFNLTFWRVILPLSGPMMATVGLFTAIGAWNSFFVPLVFTLGRPDLRTLSVGMYAFIGETSTQWTLLCAASIITVVPIIVVFLMLQRYFVNGLAGAVKQ